MLAGWRAKFLNEITVRIDILEDVKTVKIGNEMSVR